MRWMTTAAALLVCSCGPSTPTGSGGHSGTGTATSGGAESSTGGEPDGGIACGGDADDAQIADRLVKFGLSPDPNGMAEFIECADAGADYYGMWPKYDCSWSEQEVADWMDSICDILQMNAPDGWSVDRFFEGVCMEVLPSSG